ncbi:hypothetical protein BDV28DRAFT_148943 [Aspergillus coremiiformis]|uniref:Cyanovirin-N domain-containing protein n=1 Tax=Aspergillus coremiiformis TaxID=138285 RepID=A0A5N6Z6M3_9EURO|nr:hypothetical protein BDV28DRAFT_148943 [Aspergillus coremiiformis]
MHLYLPLILLPLAALAREDPPPGWGNFFGSCENIKNTNARQENDSHFLIATCKSSDGEITTKLDLTKCFKNGDDATLEPENDGNAFAVLKEGSKRECSKCNVDMRPYRLEDPKVGPVLSCICRQGKGNMFKQGKLNQVVRNDGGYLRCFDHRGELVH